jgi:DNA-binding MarR family transcriptional regulator
MDEDRFASYLYAQRFYFLAEQSLNIIKKSLAKILRDHGINHSQYLILLILRYAEFSGNEVMSTDVAYLLGLEKHSVTTVVDKLVEDGRVVRERSDADRRVVHLRLTDEGRDIAGRAQAQTMETLAVVPEQARDEFAHMCDFLTTLRSYIAESSEQPAAFYARAYETLLIQGQEAFGRARFPEGLTNGPISEGSMPEGNGSA